MKLFPLTIVIALTFILTGCSGDDSGTGSGDHVWKEQTDTIDRAKQAEQKMMEAVELQKQAIEEQIQ